jgi:hypothetical protein
MNDHTGRSGPVRFRSVYLNGNGLRRDGHQRRGAQA